VFDHGALPPEKLKKALIILKASLKRKALKDGAFCALNYPEKPLSYPHFPYVHRAKLD
jgi:hypothetical protein